MSGSNVENVEQQSRKKHSSTWRIALISLLTVIVTVLITVWVIRAYIFSKEFEPVALSQSEEQTLTHKLERLGLPVTGDESGESLQPEHYSEKGAKRELTFSEREVNAMLAKNTDLADKLVIDLSDDLVSARLLIPLDEDFPIMGGKTLKVKAGVGLAYREEKPIFILKGVSIMGVPIPNAWLGNLKNIDLIEEYGGEQGFWKSVADGIDHLVVEEGELKIKLKE